MFPRYSADKKDCGDLQLGNVKVVRTSTELERKMIAVQVSNVNIIPCSMKLSPSVCPGKNSSVKR